MVLLREKSVIAVTRACLQRIHLLATFLHGSPSRTMDPECVNVRVFLAAFMIAYRPTHVFESMGALEQALLESAIPLLETFERQPQYRLVIRALDVFVQEQQLALGARRTSGVVETAGEWWP